MVTNTQKIAIGLILLVITSTFIIVSLNNKVSVKFNKYTTGLYINESGVNSLYATESYSITNSYTLNSSIIQKLENSNKTLIISRLIYYKNGVILSEDYTFDTTNPDITEFPKTHKITILNASGKTFTYILTIPKDKDRIGQILNPISINDRVILLYDQKAIKIIHATGSLKIQYKVNSNNESYWIRLYDPETVPLDVKELGYPASWIPLGNYSFNGSLIYNKFGNMTVSIEPFVYTGKIIHANITNVPLNAFYNIFINVNNSHLKPKDLSIYYPTNSTLDKSFTCNGINQSFNYSKQKHLFDCYQNNSVWCFNNITNSSFICNYSNILVIEQIYDTIDKTIGRINWTELVINNPDKLLSFTPEFYQNQTWYVSEPIYLIKNRTYSETYNIDFGDKFIPSVFTKYDVGIKLANITLNQSKLLNLTYEIDPWYNTSWGFRSNYQIYVSTKNLTNYPINVTINSNAPANFNWSNLGNDVRFTASDGSTLLSHYLQPQSNLSFWVNVSSMTNATNTTIYMYYGNNAVTSTSNCDSALDFCDTFDSNDLSRWSGVGMTWNSTYNAGGLVYNATGAGNWMQSLNTFNRTAMGYVLQWDWIPVCLTSSSCEFRVGFANGTNASGLQLRRPYELFDYEAGTTNTIYYYDSATNTKVQAGATALKVSQKLTIWINATGGYHNVTNSSGTKTWTDTGTDNNMVVKVGPYMLSSLVDNVTVRKMLLPEPLIYLNATEETAPVTVGPIPTITIISPTNSTYVTSSIWANVTLDVAGTCNRSLDIGTNTSLSNTTGNFNNLMTSISDGYHNITFFCANTSGNLNSTMQYFSVDTTPPILNISSPSNISYKVTSIWANLTLNEPGSCNMSLNNTANVSMSNTTGNFNYNITEMTDGFKNITFYCNDTVGNKNSSIRYFTIDTVTPSLTIWSPSNTTYTTNTVWGNVTISEPGNCNIAMDSGTQYLMSNTTGNFNNLSYALSEGMHLVQFFCNDTANNSISVGTYFSVDTVKPTIVIQSPTNTTYNTSSIWANVTLNEAGFCNLSIDGASNISLTNSTGNFNYLATSVAQGVRDFRFWCNDTIGNLNTTNVYLRVDTSGPNLTIYSPTNITYNSSNLWFNFSYEDISNITSCDYSINGSTNISLTSTLYTTTGGYSGNLTNPTNFWDSDFDTYATLTSYNSVANTSYPYVIYNNPNSYNMSTFSFKTDVNGTTNAQTIDLYLNGDLIYQISHVSSNPTTYNVSVNLSKYSGALNFSFTATVLSKNLLTYAYMYLYETGLNVNYTSKLLNFSEGQDNITLYCNDSVGNLNHSTIYFSVDTVPPTNIQYISPTNSNNSYTNKSYEYINTSFTELNPSSCQISNGTTNYTGTIVGTSYCYYNLTSIPEGNLTTIVYLNDTANNWNNSNRRIFVHDYTIPDVRIRSPTNTTYTTSSVWLNYTVSDTYLQKVWYYVNGTYRGLLTTNVSLTFPDGQQNITIYANDSANNINTSTIYFRVDATAPLVTIYSPTNSTYNTTNIWFNWTTDDTSGVCKYSINGTSNTTISTNNSLNFSLGHNNITVYCNDSVGNLGSDTEWFTIDTSAPNITLYTPINFSTSSNRTQSFLFNAVDNLAPTMNCSLLINNSITKFIQGVPIIITNNTPSPASNISGWWYSSVGGTTNYSQAWDGMWDTGAYTNTSYGVWKTASLSISYTISDPINDSAILKIKIGNEAWPNADNITISLNNNVFYTKNGYFHSDNVSIPFNISNFTVNNSLNFLINVTAILNNLSNGIAIYETELTYYSSGYYAIISNNTNTTFINSDSLSNGWHYANIKCTDSAGNSGLSNYRYFKIFTCTILVSDETLTGNLYSTQECCLSFSNPFKTLDCGGYSVYNSGNYSGVCNNQVGTIIKNCNISNFNVSIKANQTDVTNINTLYSYKYVTNTTPNPVDYVPSEWDFMYPASNSFDGNWNTYAEPYPLLGIKWINFTYNIEKIGAPLTFRFKVTLPDSYGSSYVNLSLFLNNISIYNQTNRNLNSSTVSKELLLDSSLFSNSSINLFSFRFNHSTLGGYPSQLWETNLSYSYVNRSNFNISIYDDNFTTYSRSNQSGSYETIEFEPTIYDNSSILKVQTYTPYHSYNSYNGSSTNNGWSSGDYSTRDHNFNTSGFIQSKPINWTIYAVHQNETYYSIIQTTDGDKLPITCSLITPTQAYDGSWSTYGAVLANSASNTYRSGTCSYTTNINYNISNYNLSSSDIVNLDLLWGTYDQNSNCGWSTRKPNISVSLNGATIYSIQNATGTRINISFMPLSYVIDDYLNFNITLMATMSGTHTAQSRYCYTRLYETRLWIPNGTINGSSSINSASTTYSFSSASLPYNNITVNYSISPYENRTNCTKFYLSLKDSTNTWRILDTKSGYQLTNTTANNVSVQVNLSQYGFNDSLGFKTYNFNVTINPLTAGCNISGLGSNYLLGGRLYDVEVNNSFFNCYNSTDCNMTVAIKHYNGTYITLGVIDADTAPNIVYNQSFPFSLYDYGYNYSTLPTIVTFNISTTPNSYISIFDSVLITNSSERAGHLEVSNSTLNSTYDYLIQANIHNINTTFNTSRYIRTSGYLLNEWYVRANASRYSTPNFVPYSLGYYGSLVNPNLFNDSNWDTYTYVSQDPYTISSILARYPFLSQYQYDTLTLQVKAGVEGSSCVGSWMTINRTFIGSAFIINNTAISVYNFTLVPSWYDRLNSKIALDYYLYSNGTACNMTLYETKIFPQNSCYKNATFSGSTNDSSQTFYENLSYSDCYSPWRLIKTFKINESFTSYNNETFELEDYRPSEVGYAYYTSNPKILNISASTTVNFTQYFVNASVNWGSSNISGFYYNLTSNSQKNATPINQTNDVGVLGIYVSQSECPSGNDVYFGGTFPTCLNFYLNEYNKTTNYTLLTPSYKRIVNNISNDSSAYVWNWISLTSCTAGTDLQFDLLGKMRCRT